MSQTEVWTVKRILEWTTTHLQKHGSESPRLEAEILLAHARRCERIQLYTRYDDPLTDNERAIMRDLVSRRAKKEPVAYLVGFREFYSLKFKVSHDVLIPRPDTETLVMEGLDLSRKFLKPRVLELCTGSGCVAVAFAANHLNARVVATDISPAALSIAAENANQHKVSDRIEFKEGDLFQAVQGMQGKFDLIMSNPPYVTTGELNELEADVVKYEPHLALDGGADGLDLVRKIIRQAVEYLNPEGHLLIEMDPAQVEATLKFAAEETEFKTSRFLNDSTGRPRVYHASFQEPPSTEVNLLEEFDPLPENDLHIEQERAEDEQIEDEQAEYESSEDEIDEIDSSIGTNSLREE
ncbi:MAG: peptide chain release factor N(5)-glutamine methyltransferase [Planctomycetaceae bacterium]